ncbi:hypothetical protein LHJ74_06055 [Streptomyces sp. N2-109]|uniref:Uncharacterized protein n=1 Tax=Streptomyces gossypii TaxID=2883101 RepID=A0ABT2JNN9_9ACTN|nr:hypothetical protein [Streptomyces gossypii]MCT2589493.1 hypothetical protein [Streptomyces gossypii]
MSNIEKASRDAVEAARQGEQFAVVLAAVQAAQQAQSAPCQHHQATQPASAPAVSGSAAGKWLAIGIGGSFLALALAISFIAVAIGAIALTVCVVILRSIWTDFRKDQ